MPFLDGFKLVKHWWTPLAVLAVIVVALGMLKHTHLLQVVVLVAVVIYLSRRHHRAKAKAEQTAEPSLNVSEEHLEHLADLLAHRLRPHPQPGPQGYEQHSVN